MEIKSKKFTISQIKQCDIWLRRKSKTQPAFHGTHVLEKLTAKTKINLIALFAFFLIAAYKYLLLGSARDYYIGDEIQWMQTLKNSNFYDNVIEKDAGYFVFVSKLLLFVFNQIVFLNAYYLHISTIFLTSLCCVSVIYLLRDKLKPKNSFILTFLIGTYPDFGLLTYMNISYFVFIPCLILVIRMNLLYKIKILDLTVILILTIWVAKPQLLLVISCVVLVKNIYFTTTFHKFSPTILVFFTASLLFGISRFESPLSLMINTELPLQLILNVFYIPASVFFPTISALLFGFFKMNEIFSAVYPFKVAIVTFSFWIIMRSKRKFALLDNNTKIYSNLLLVSAIVLYLSFFLDPSSSFYSVYPWEINCRSCVYNRHIFPFFVVLLLLLLNFIKNNATVTFVLLGLLIQQVTVTYLAYDYLFAPVLKI